MRDVNRYVAVLAGANEPVEPRSGCPRRDLGSLTDEDVRRADHPHPNGDAATRRVHEERHVPLQAMLTCSDRPPAFASTSTVAPPTPPPACASSAYWPAAAFSGTTKEV